MNPTTILIVLLTVVAMRPFFEVPETLAKAEALRKSGYKPNAARSCMYLLLVPVVLGLWWWYALTTDQMLLGVIPSVGMVTTLVAGVVEQQAAKGRAA